MGEIADLHVRNFTSGRWGMRIAAQREFPTTTKAAIAGHRFSIVKITGFRTGRKYGSKLVVTENDETSYWVWASSAVTGIARDQCEVVEADLDLSEALLKTGRKAYKPHVPATVEADI